MYVIVMVKSFPLAHLERMTTAQSEQAVKGHTACTADSPNQLQLTLQTQHQTAAGMESAQVRPVFIKWMGLRLAQ